MSTIAEIIALREEGLIFHEIAEKLSLSEARIKQVIKEHLPEMYKQVAYRLNAVKVHKMLKAGLKYPEIAAKLGFSEKTAWEAACIGQDIYNRRNPLTREEG